MCLLHYPFHEHPQHEKGAEAHTDCQIFTMLWQQPGIQALEVRNSQNQWIQVPPIPGTFLIIVGNFFARRTNDIFKPCIHQVTNPNGRERYSVTVSFGTESSLKLEPIPGCSSPERRYRYEILTAGECSKKSEESIFETLPDPPHRPVGH
ncbi:hypothetical protein AX14_002809 [Amanita brunnescens Koide BX004]|nr:hypothetical protein AX14_002809 [Amanita brunnescens Koide BX004]